MPDLKGCVSPVFDLVPSGKMISTLPGCARSWPQMARLSRTRICRAKGIAFMTTAANQVRDRPRKK